VDVDQFRMLREHGVVDHKVEFLEGRLVTGDGYELALSPAQMRAARALGLEPRSYVDAVLEDAQTLAELRARLSASRRGLTDKS
jgi:hypothetical protein